MDNELDDEEFGLSEDDIFEALQSVLFGAEIDRIDGDDIPFDVASTFSTNPALYGDPGQGPLLGKTVRFLGGSVTATDGETFDAPERIGIVVGHAHGRVVLFFEGLGFIGWIAETAVEPLMVFVPETVKWLH